MSDQEMLLEKLLKDEAELQFTSFSNEQALQLGLALLAEARKKPKGITIDISRNGQQLFHYAMAGTTIDNDKWIQRKINVVNRFGHSSYYIGQVLQHAGKTMEEKYFVSSLEFTAHGGSFPLILKGTGIIGTVTVSGLPQVEDHELVVTTLRKILEG